MEFFGVAVSFGEFGDVHVVVHRAEFSDTSGTFSLACSAKFEIARVKRRETIKKMAENGATSTTPYLFSFYTAH